MNGRKRIGMLSALVLCVLLWCGGAWAQESKPALTMNDVIQLSRKGEALTAADFEGYEGTVYGMNHTVRYEIDADYELEIDASPFMIRLYYRKIDRCGIDIRYFDVEEFVNCGDKSKYILYNRRMTEADFLRLYELGDGLRYDHFMHFDDGGGGWMEYGAENSVNFWSEYKPLKGYILHMGDDDLEGVPIRVWLMKESAPEYCMDIREGNLEEFIEGGKNLPEKPRMTMEDVKAFAEKGMALSWDDLRQYQGEYEIDGLIRAVYPIDETYCLKADGSDWDEVPYRVYLCKGEWWSDSYIDIRWESVEEFVGAQDNRIYKRYGQRISREDVRRMAAQGNALCFDMNRYCPDNMFYTSMKYEWDTAVHQYVLDDTFSLLVEIDMGSGEINGIRLMLNTDPEVYVDIRKGDVNAFFAQYDSAENRYTGQMTWECVRSVYEAGMLLSVDLWDAGDAKNIGMGENFSLYRYAVEDSHILLMVLPNDKKKGYRPKAYLISSENEDDFVDLWAGDEDVSEYLREIEQQIGA